MRSSDQDHHRAGSHPILPVFHDSLMAWGEEVIGSVSEQVSITRPHGPGSPSWIPKVSGPHHALIIA